MHLLDPYFFIRDCFWWLRAPKATRKWKGKAPREYLISPEPPEDRFKGHELQKIHVRSTGEMKGVVRTETEGHIIFREFYFEGGDLVAVREYGWAVDFFLPRRAMVRWRNEIDATTLPFRRRGRTKYLSMGDSEIEEVASKLIEIARHQTGANKPAMDKPAMDKPDPAAS